MAELTCQTKKKNYPSLPPLPLTRPDSVLLSLYLLPLPHHLATCGDKQRELVHARKYHRLHPSCWYPQHSLEQGGTSLVPCHARCRVGCSVCVGGVGDRQEDDGQCFVTINTLTMAIVLYLVGDLIGVGVVNHGRVVSNTFVGMLLVPVLSLSLRRCCRRLTEGQDKLSSSASLPLPVLKASVEIHRRRRTPFTPNWSCGGCRVFGRRCHPHHCGGNKGKFDPRGWGEGGGERERERKRGFGDGIFELSSPPVNRCPSPC